MRFPLSPLVLALCASGCARPADSERCIAHLALVERAARAELSAPARMPWQGAVEFRAGARWRVLGALTEKTRSGGRIEVRYIHASDRSSRLLRDWGDADDEDVGAFWDAWDETLAPPWRPACAGK